MNYSPILAPVVALVAWTLVVMLWMVVSRAARRSSKAGHQPRAACRGGSRGVDLEGNVDPTRRSGNRTITII